MTVSSERRVVQNSLIHYATEASWTCLAPDQTQRLRRGKENPLLHQVLVDQLQRLNPGVVDLRKAEESRPARAYSPEYRGKPGSISRDSGSSSWRPNGGEEMYTCWIRQTWSPTPST